MVCKISFIVVLLRAAGKDGRRASGLAAIVGFGLDAVTRCFFVGRPSFTALVRLSLLFKTWEVVVFDLESIVEPWWCGWLSLHSVLGSGTGSRRK